MDRCVGDAVGNDDFARVELAQPTLCSLFRSVFIGTVWRGPCMSAGASIVNRSPISYLLFLMLASVIVSRLVHSIISIPFPHRASILVVYCPFYCCMNILFYFLLCSSSVYHLLLVGDGLFAMTNEQL